MTERSSPARRPADGKHARPATSGRSVRSGWKGADEATRVTADILAGPLAWGGIGWLVDRWLGTDPWLMSLGVMAGFAGALYLVWLRTGRSRQDERQPPGGTGEDRDTEG